MTAARSGRGRNHVQAPHQDRRGGLHRFQRSARRPGQDRRWRLCGVGLGDHPQRAGGRARGRAGPAGD